MTQLANVLTARKREAFPNSQHSHGMSIVQSIYKHVSCFFYACVIGKPRSYRCNKHEQVRTLIGVAGTTSIALQPELFERYGGMFKCGFKQNLIRSDSLIGCYWSL